MPRTKKQDEDVARRQKIVMDNACAAASGEVPFGYTSFADWHETTLRHYAKLFKDDEFRAEFEAVVGTREAPILSWSSDKKTPPGKGPRRTTRVAAPATPLTGPEAEAREYLTGYEGTFEFLNDLRLKFVVQHPTWTMSERQVAAVLKCKARDEQHMDVGRPRENKGPAVTEDGIYQTDDGTVYKVQKAVHGTGRLYAKKLNVETTSFEYESGAVFRLRADQKMTLEQAKAFGKLYGVCCNCGRTLTDEGSIAEGIGPICAGKEWF